MSAPMAELTVEKVKACLPDTSLETADSSSETLLESPLVVIPYHRTSSCGSSGLTMQG